jgi:iron complex outermembrane recepter protein
MRKSTLRNTAFIAFVFCAIHAKADESATAGDTNNTTELPKVVVSASKREQELLQTPAAIDSIDRGDLLNTQARVSVAESLNRIAGVTARDRQNDAQDAQISIRGYGTRASFGVRGLRLYTDGIPASMPDGQGQVSHFALDSAQRIEVLRGPFSALYGNSSGGVIHLIGRKPPADLQTQINSYFAADQSWRASASLGDSFTQTQNGYWLDISRNASDGFREHSESQRSSAQLRLQGAWSERDEWLFIANHLQQRAQDPQGLNSAELAQNPRAASANASAFNTRKTVSQQQLGAQWKHAFDAGDLHLNAYAGARDVEQFLSVPRAAQNNPLNSGGVINLDRRYQGADLRWSWDHSGENHSSTFSLGSEWQALREQRQGFENFIGSTLGVRGVLRRDERQDVNNRDIYAQWLWRYNEHWVAQAGIRRSKVSFAVQDFYLNSRNPDDSGQLDFSATTPALGLLYRPTPHTSVYLNWGRGFETPTITELSYRNDGLSGLNTELKASRSVQAEWGLRYLKDSTELSIALFNADTSNDIVLASNLGGRSSFRNAPGTQRHGLELNWSTTITAKWSIALAYTYLDAEFSKPFLTCSSTPCATPNQSIAAGSPLPGIAKHSIWSELGWEPTQDLRLALQAQWTDKIFADDASTAFAPSALRVDLSAEQKWKLNDQLITGFIRINNVFDRQIIGSVIVNESNGRYFEPAPRREWSAGLSFDF